MCLIKALPGSSEKPLAPKKFYWLSGQFGPPSLSTQETINMKAAEEWVFLGVCPYLSHCKRCQWWLSCKPNPILKIPKVDSFWQFKADITGAASMPLMHQNSPSTFRSKTAALLVSHAMLQGSLGNRYPLSGGVFVWYWFWYKYCSVCIAMLY